MKIAFIGVGAIGLPMAQRLLSSHEVTVFDLSNERVDELVALGARSAKTAAEAAAGADATLIMVATPDQLSSALFSAGGVADGARPGSIIAIMSSVGIETVHEAAPAFIERGIRVLDCPVTGGVVRARTGELTLLLGGAAADIDQLRPVLELMGTRLAICGANPGDGQAVKLINQHLCSAHLVVAAEALNLAGAVGLDPEAVLDIVSPGAAGSFMLSDRGPRMLLDDPPVLSAIDIFVKDTQLVQDTGRDLNARTPLLDAAAAEFRRARSAGHGREDDSAVYRTYRTDLDNTSSTSCHRCGS